MRRLLSLDVLIVASLALVVVGQPALKEVRAAVEEISRASRRPLPPPPVFQQVSFEAPNPPPRPRVEFLELEDAQPPHGEWEGQVEYRPVPYQRPCR